MEPTTLRQSRGKAALVVLGCLAFVGLGVLFLGDTDGSPRYGPEATFAIAIACIGGFGAFGVLGVMQLVRPPQLVIAPGGLTYVWLWSRKTWAWSDVGPFVVEGTRSTGTIRFDVAPRGRVGLFAARPGIPGLWGKGIAEVCDHLNAARECWR